MNTVPDTTLVIRAPARRAAERAWVNGVLFERWLGLATRTERHDGDEVVVQIHHAGELRGEVAWHDHFFAQADARWCEPDTCPSLPLAMWPLPSECPEVRAAPSPPPEGVKATWGGPALPWEPRFAALAQAVGEPSLAQPFGDGRFECLPGRIRLPIDISGSAFFMLSRYEESVRGAAADRHGRFPGRASLAQRAGLALRPLVDEWLELLWWALAQLAPGLQRRPRQASTWVSCDVDAPFSAAGLGLGPALRQTASHLVNDRSPRLAAQALLHGAASRVGVQRFDAFDTFDWMLDANERAGHRVTFFFLSLQRPAPIDGRYTLAEPRVAALLRRIVARGHEVGLHGSYASVDDAPRQAAELAGLREAVVRAGGEGGQVAGARQHYLRWRAGRSARQLHALGLAYDSTLGFADVAGFRCGTCHAFPLFDIASGQPTTLLERPLVLMEVTVTSPVYLGLGHGDEAAALMQGLRARCRRFGGEFSLLWHNSNLALPAARALYRALIEG